MPSPGVWRRVESMALVVTLLLLSVITFLAIAFLAMTGRNRSAVSATLDVTTARAMNDAAVGRAHSEILAQMIAQSEPLYYDYMVSHNYINSKGYYHTNRTTEPNNVNYDYLAPPALPNTPLSAQDWVQNIGNLWYDPRPPVFVVTNPAYPANYDFRFWVDINRNGRFETNGSVPYILDNGLTNGNYVLVNGEPEFIGVLKNPLYPHSVSNQFIGRYAYLVLPIGKELDINYIHNWAKDNYANLVPNYLTNSAAFSFRDPYPNDGFARDQGVGSWELNLAALLDAVSPWAYESNNTSLPAPYSPYSYAQNLYAYYPPEPFSLQANTGSAFDDAVSILHYRYWVFDAQHLASLGQDLPLSYTNFLINNIDSYCASAPLTYPFDNTSNPSAVYVQRGLPWPGSYSTNLFFDPQELFDPTKTSANYTNRMLLAGARTNTWDRYTFERLLSCVAMGSSPEYGVWVNGDFASQNNFFSGGYIPPAYPPQILRTKVNINYDNTSQITNVNAPYTPMPTNLVSWTPLGFFTNAADLLLRSQTFVFSNYIVTASNTILGLPIYACFGVTDIPIYRTNNSGIQYNEAIHRMLQLAANIYDATISTNAAAQLRFGPILVGGTVLPPVRYPTVFRPRFGLATVNKTNVGVNIIGYVQVTNDTYSQIAGPQRGGFRDLPQIMNDLIANPTNAADENACGIPWVVAVEKGNPQFNEYTYGSGVLFERKMLFCRSTNSIGQPATNLPPKYTNQFYCMAVSNSFGMDAWNPYPSPFYGHNQGFYFYLSNYITIQYSFTSSNYNYGYITNVTNGTFVSPGFCGVYQLNPWPAWPLSSKSFVTMVSNNVTTLPPCYFSESRASHGFPAFVYFTNGAPWTNQFLPVDMSQTAWPVHYWTLNITNHVVYALFDGDPRGNSTTSSLLDFVNLGPFGSTLNVSSVAATGGGGGLGMSGGGNNWTVPQATDSPTSSPMSAGALNQITSCVNTNAEFGADIFGARPGQQCDAGFVFGTPFDPAIVVEQPEDWVANDPLVHYTVGDLTWPGQTDGPPNPNWPLYAQITNGAGQLSKRYSPWGSGRFASAMLFMDPQLTNSVAWQFPTNKFPGVGWIGRVHRGTPWQTVYLKPDDPINSGLWSGDLAGRWVHPVGVEVLLPPYSQETYPTNDWALVDLFTAVPNDNAARGLLSVNQTNAAAWAAVFAGVIAPTNGYNGTSIWPADAVNLANAINAWRYSYSTNPAGVISPLYPNGVFHHVGDILGASLLYSPTNLLSPYPCTNMAIVLQNTNNTDEVVERIPQQTLSLLKVGEPQFAIFAWGQALKPKGPPSLGTGPNIGMYTNYEITGEFLSRTVCHLVRTNGLKMVIDSYNVEPGNF